jgi:ribosome-associated protein
MQKTEFVLSGEYIELNNLLKLTGVCDSGGAGKALVASGAVTVDGQVEMRKTCKIRAGQKVAVGDIEINVLPAPESGIAIAD